MGFREEFFELVCGYQAVLWMGCIFFVFLFILSVMMLALDPTASTTDLSILNATMSAVGFLGLGALFYNCKRRSRY